MRLAQLRSGLEVSSEDCLTDLLQHRSRRLLVLQRCKGRHGVPPSMGPGRQYNVRMGQTGCTRLAYDVACDTSEAIQVSPNVTPWGNGSLGSTPTLLKSV